MRGREFVDRLSVSWKHGEAVFEKGDKTLSLHTGLRVCPRETPECAFIIGESIKKISRHADGRIVVAEHKGAPDISEPEFDGIGIHGIPRPGSGT
jgi:hypothetical protein